MDVFSPKAGFLSARIGLLALVSVAAAASGVALAPGSARAEVLARVPAAREMAVCGDVLFVGTKRSSVYAVPVSGGRARRVASGFSAPNGVACSRGRLFVASRDRVTAFDIGPGGALSGRRDIRRGLPNSGAHSLRYIAVGPDSRLYVSFGSPCNICLPRGLQSTIVSMNQDGSDLRRVAWGVRNSVGFDWRGGTMFFTDNGADRMGDDIPPGRAERASAGPAFMAFPTSEAELGLKGSRTHGRPRSRFRPFSNFKRMSQPSESISSAASGATLWSLSTAVGTGQFQSGVRSCACASGAAGRSRRRLSSEASAGPWMSRKRRTVPCSYPTTPEARFTFSGDDARRFL